MEAWTWGKNRVALLVEWLRVPDLMLKQRHSDNGQVNRGPSLTNKIIFLIICLFIFPLHYKSRKSIRKMTLKQNVNSATSKLHEETSKVIYNNIHDQPSWIDSIKNIECEEENVREKWGSPKWSCPSTDLQWDWASFWCGILGRKELTEQAWSTLLGKACFKVGPWLASRNLDFERVLITF